MISWFKSKRNKSVVSNTPSLDFQDPDPEKFADSVSQWRKSLEAKRIQDKKLDQSQLNFMAPEALAELKQNEVQRRKELAAEKRAATKKKLEAEAKKQATAAKKPAASKTTRPAAKKPATKPAAKPAAKTATKPTAAKTAAKPATRKPAAKKPVAAKKTSPAPKTK